MVERTYVVKIVDEPDEQPITLSQAEMDMMLTLGSQQPVLDGRTRSFATVETADGEPFIHNGVPIDEDVAAEWLSRAFTAAVLAAIENHRMDDPEPELESE